MPVIPIIKGAVLIASSLGVNRIVTEIVRNNTTVVTVADKVIVSAGSIALSSVACAATYDHISGMFDQVGARFRKNEEVAAEA